MALSFPVSLDTHTWIYYRVSTVHIYLIGYPLLETSFVVTGDIRTTKVQPVIIILVINKCYKNQRNPILGSYVSPGLVYPTRNSKWSQSVLQTDLVQVPSFVEPDHTGSSQTNLIPIDHYYHDTVLLLLSVALGRDEGSFGHVGIPILSPVLVNSDHWSEWQWLVP